MQELLHLKEVSHSKVILKRKNIQTLWVWILKVVKSTKEDGE